MDNPKSTSGDNMGLYERFGLVQLSKECHFRAPILNDILELDKWLLNGVDVQLKLWPAKDKFVLIKDNATKGEFQLEILDVYLDVCKISLDQELLNGHEKVLLTQKATYPYKRRNIQTFSLAKGSYQYRNEALFQYDQPKRIVAGFVLSSAYEGAYDKNPFNFQNFDIREIALYLNDVSIPAQPMKLNFGTFDFLEAYEATQDRSKYIANGIKPYDFNAGYALFCFDITGGIGNDFLQLMERSNVRLEVHFNTPLQEPVTAVIMGEFSSAFTIDANRNVK